MLVERFTICSGEQGFSDCLLLTRSEQYSQYYYVVLMSVGLSKVAKGPILVTAIGSND